MFADNNLFNPAWTTGNLSAIAPIVQVVGFFAMCLISIGGFFMVILPLMRNVVNGIVCVAPNLCDKIDEAHRTKLGLKMSHDGNQISATIGSLGMIILSFFPNFKALSDFDEGVRDPKSYMMKAIPMMCVYVFIGVFVFYGYPAKFAEKFSTAATSLIDVVLNNVDAQAWIEKIPMKLTRPDFSTNGSSDNLGKNTNKMAKELYSALTSKYNDMSSDNRVTVSHEVEAFCNEALSNVLDKSDSDKFKMTVEARIIDYDPKINEKAAFPTFSYDEKEHIYMSQLKGPIDGNFSTGVPGGTAGDNFLIVIKFYELAEEGASMTNVTCTAHLKQSDFQSNAAKNGVTWNIPDGVFTFSIGNKVQFNGFQGTISADKKSIVFDNTTIDKINNGTGGTSGIYVKDPTNTSFQHTVNKVQIGGNDYHFDPVDSSKWNSWKQGESPTPKQAASTNGDEESTDDGRQNANN